MVNEIDTTRTTKSGATIRFQRTIDKPATKAMEIVESAKKKSKEKKGKKAPRILGKPKAQGIKRLSAVKAIKGIAQATDTRMVTQGKTGFIDEEMLKEKTDFFGGYSL